MKISGGKKPGHVPMKSLSFRRIMKPFHTPKELPSRVLPSFFSLLAAPKVLNCSHKWLPSLNKQFQKFSGRLIGLIHLI
jgi:hypothetical protein